MTAADDGLSSVIQHASNLRTREDWLHVIIHSGQVTRVGQHLALVIYHLADNTTNIAKLSARDLERITGWGRTAIIKHLNELHEFIHVTWGAGRAKSIFELQGVIASAMQQKKAERAVATQEATEADTTADAIVDTKTDTSGSVHVADTDVDTTTATTTSVHEVATQADTTADTSVCVHSCVHEVDTNAEKSAEGGTIGGETTKTQVSEYLSLSSREREKTATAPDWMVSEDGGFEGQVFELSGVEVGALQTTYSYLEFPADIVSVDQFLARQFEASGQSPPMKDRLARMHTYLAKRNREAREFRLQMGLLGKPPPRPKQSEPIAPAEQPSCWFDDDARLQVANGFRTELLEKVGGDEIRMREELDKAAGWVGISVRGPQLIAKVRSQFTRQMKAQPSAAQNCATSSRRERIRKYAEEAEAKLRAQQQPWSGRQ